MKSRGVLFKRLLIVVPIVCGVILVGVMKNTKKPPKKVAGRERVRTVRVLPLEKMRVRPRVTGYGYVIPDRTWEAIAEVGGKVVHMAPHLKKGNFFKKGDLLFRLDPEAYGLAETRGRAELLNLEAQLKELEQTRKNTSRVLETERRSLAILAQEVKRKKDLFAKGVISASTLEQEERRFLSQQTVVNNLENTLRLIPSRKKALLARKTSGLSTVKTRQLDIAKTEFVAPFDGRISRVDIELGQFAPAGSLLIMAQSIERCEIPVPLPPSRFMALMPRFQGRLDAVPDMVALGKKLGLKARVRLILDKGREVSWTGHFSRTGDAADPKTGTVTVFVTVDHPYGDIIPGKRPPLAAQMYVAVDFFGQGVPDQWVVPRTAVHGQGKDAFILLASLENRLVTQKVGVDFFAGELAVLTPGPGLESGARVILSDLVPAVEGMKLIAVTDEEAVTALAEGARGGLPWTP